MTAQRYSYPIIERQSCLTAYYPAQKRARALPSSLKKQRAKLGEGCPARPLRGRAPDCGWKGLFGDSPACSGIGIAFPPGMWYCVAVEAAQYNTD